MYFTAEKNQCAFKLYIPQHVPQYKNVKAQLTNTFTYLHLFTETLSLYIKLSIQCWSYIRTNAIFNEQQHMLCLVTGWAVIP